MEIVNLPLIPLIILNLALGLFVLLNNRRSVVNQSFFGLIVFITLWILSNFLIDNLKSHSIVLFWTRFSYVSGIFIPLFYFYFAASFRGILNSFKNPSYLIKTSSVSLILAILSFTSFIVKDVTTDSQGVELITGIGLTPYFLIFLSYMLLGSYYLFLAYRRGGALKKLQLKYFLVGTLVTALLVVSLNFIIPSIFKIWTLATYTPYSTLIMLGSISYAIVRHRLLDIEVIIRRSLVYSTLLTALIGLYSLLVFGLNRIFLP